MKKIQFSSFLLGMYFSAITIAASDNRNAILSILQSISLKSGDEVMFTETRIIDLLENPIVSKGMLKRNQNDTLTKVFVDTNESLVISEIELRKTQSGHETVLIFSDHVEAQQLGIVIRALFKTDMSTLEEFFSFYLKQQEQQWIIELLPIKKPLSDFLQSIVLTGEETHLIATEIIKNNGDVIVTNFKDKSK